MRTSVRELIDKIIEIKKKNYETKYYRISFEEAVDILKDLEKNYLLHSFGVHPCPDKTNKLMVKRSIQGMHWMGVEIVPDWNTYAQRKWYY